MTSLRTLLAASALAGAFAIAGAAQAATTVTVSDLTFTWGTPTAASGNVADLDLGYSGNGSDNATVSWGVPSPAPGPQSGYNLTALASSWTANVNPPPSSPVWDIADFTHFNNVIQISGPNTSITGVPLTLTANVTVGSVTNSYNFDFNVNHDETPNDILPCPYGPAGLTGINSAGCADSVTFNFLNTSDSFEIDGVKYTLNILGFTQDGEEVTNFLSKEKRNNTATLRAQITTFAAATNVPEPATWAMLIAGFGMVGLVARRRRHSASTARVDS